jgi:hypothetical protein
MSQHFVNLKMVSGRLKHVVVSLNQFTPPLLVEFDCPTAYLNWFYCVATKPGVIEKKICESIDCLKAALSSAMTSLQIMVASATSV